MNFTFNFKLGLALLMLPAGVACGPGRPPTPPPRDGGDAQRLVAIMDYVGGDYSLAVQSGKVVSAAEYEEQLRFLDDSRAMASGLLGPATLPSDPVLAGIAEVEAQVRSLANADTVNRSCRRVKDDVVIRFGLRTMPDQRPSLARAQTLYAESCATCHGARGDAATERARLLDPPPASFRDPRRLDALSPYRVYNALTFGVPGTAMASFDSLTPADRWSLAFYVFRLGHDDGEAQGPAAMTLADLAVRSDREVLEVLRAEQHPSPASGLGYLRREAAFLEPPTGVGIDTTRRRLRAAVDAFAAGRQRDADRLVLDAYLEGFEPLEPRLRARHADDTVAVETAFRDLRAAFSQDDAPGARAAGRRLEAALGRLETGGRPVLPFVAAFLIYFREGVEAALLVGALLAGLRRLGRGEASRYVHLGWILALPAGVLTWWLFDRILSVAAPSRELMEAVTALTAAAVLFTVSFWMISKAESRRWLGYLRGGLEASLTRKNLFVVAGLAFLAVYREAAETVLFSEALLLESDGHSGQVWSGALAGLLTVAAVAVLMNRTVLRLPLGPFFAVSSALLCALAISFAGSGIYELVAAGYLSPRPVSFPEVPWMGIHPDLTALLVQLSIVCVIAAAGVATLRRRMAAPGLPPKP